MHQRITSAHDIARRAVAEVRDHPAARLALLVEQYDLLATTDRRAGTYGRAAIAFMQWQLRRGVLAPWSAAVPGSEWWRAINEALLLDTCEAIAMAGGAPASSATSAGALATLDFVRDPSPHAWYRAHNTSVATAYVEHQELARLEGRVERFFINLVLARVTFTHAMVARPDLALGRLGPAGTVLGDPRSGLVDVFMSLARVMPDRYPLGIDLERFVARESAIGHLVDVGVVVPRLDRLYAWSAAVLDVPSMRTFVDPLTRVPAYAWDPQDRDVWNPEPSMLARAAARLVAPAARREPAVGGWLGAAHAVT